MPSPPGWDILRAVRALRAQVPCLESKLRAQGALDHALPNSQPSKLSKALYFSVQS